MYKILTRYPPHQILLTGDLGIGKSKKLYDYKTS